MRFPRVAYVKWKLRACECHDLGSAQSLDLLSAMENRAHVTGGLRSASRLVCTDWMVSGKPVRIQATRLKADLIENSSSGTCSSRRRTPSTLLASSGVARQAAHQFLLGAAADGVQGNAAALAWHVPLRGRVFALKPHSLAVCTMLGYHLLCRLLESNVATTKGLERDHRRRCHDAVRRFPKAVATGRRTHWKKREPSLAPSWLS